MAGAPYIGSDVPAEVITTDGFTTLFEYAQQKLDDALLWWQIAAVNGLADPFVGPGVALAIPRSAADNNDGIPA